MTPEVAVDAVADGVGVGEDIMYVVEEVTREGRLSGETKGTASTVPTLVPASGEGGLGWGHAQGECQGSG